MTKILGIKLRYFNSAQFKGIATAVVMLGLSYFFAYHNVPELSFAAAGALLMRLFTLRRFY